MQQPNQNPVIEPVPPQTLTAGQTIDVPFQAYDPDGDPLTVTAQPVDSAIASASVPQMGTLRIQANAPGSTDIVLRAEDGRGGIAETALTVTVEQPAPPPPTEAPPPDGGANLGEIPVLTPIEGNVLATVREIYRRGQGASPPVNPGVFSVAGDSAPDRLLADLGDGQADFGTLPDAGALNDLLFYYTSTALQTGGNSFSDAGRIASRDNWTAGELLKPGNAPNSCPQGLNPLECELQVNRPAVIMIAIGRNDALSNTPENQFRQQLDRIVTTAIQNGTIPVLVTVPGDPAQIPHLNAINTAIVDTARQYNVPLINLWRGLSNVPGFGAGNDLALTGSGAGDVFTEAELNQFGIPNRNLLILRMLQQIRINVPIP